VYGLDGKVAVVTGGGRGIGRGVAFGLGEAGAKVFVNDYYRGEARGAAEDVADEIHAAGGIAVANGGDISSFAGGGALIEAARKEFGRVDILVTCAGNFWPDMTLDVTEERWNAQLAVHATGTFACAQAAAKLMVEQGDGGRIITFSSRGAFFGPTPAYAAAKGAVMAMTAALSADLSARGITANCVLPSATTQLFPGDDASARTFGGVAAAESLLQLSCRDEAACAVVGARGRGNHQCRAEQRRENQSSYHRLLLLIRAIERSWGAPGHGERGNSLRNRGQGTRRRSACGTTSKRAGVVPGCSPSRTTGTAGVASTSTVPPCSTSIFGCERCLPR